MFGVLTSPLIQAPSAWAQDLRVAYPSDTNQGSQIEAVSALGYAMHGSPPWGYNLPDCGVASAWCRSSVF